jgi:hypothetical protein
VDLFDETFKRKFAHIQVPESIMLDSNNNPTASSSVVTEKGNLFGVRLKSNTKISLVDYSIPRNFKAAALSTFALSVGYHNRETRAVFTDTDDLLPVFEGTAVAIDPHHLLTTAHILELDLLQYSTKLDGLKYQYCRRQLS